MFKSISSLNISVSDPQAIKHVRLPTMENTGRLILLLAIIINLCHARSQCTSIDFCWMQNARWVSGYSSLISRQSMYPMTCPAKCSFNPGCIAATDDPNTELCELHEAGPDGTPCRVWDTAVGFSFWMRKPYEKPCPQVRCEKLISLYDI